MDVRLEDEALFVVPGSGALWVYDFGEKTKVLEDAREGESGPVFQVAQAVAGDHSVYLVLPTLMAPSVDDQETIRAMLDKHEPGRAIAMVIDSTVGKAQVVAGEPDIAEPVAAVAAVVRRVWSWDEVEEFTITVDEQSYAVRTDHDGEVWTAVVTMS